MLLRYKGESEILQLFIHNVKCWQIKGIRELNIDIQQLGLI